MTTTVLLIVGIYYLLGVVIAVLLWSLGNRMHGENCKPDAIPLLSWIIVAIELVVIIISVCAKLFNKINYILCKQSTTKPY